MRNLITRQTESPKALSWAKRHLFSGSLNSLLTLVSLVFLAFTLPPLLQWAIFDATWLGTDRTACQEGGACWVFITARIDQFIYGFYPSAERWRVNMVLTLFVASIVGFSKKGTSWHKALGIWFFVVFPLIAWILLLGGFGFLPRVETRLWGGMFLTLVIAVVGITSSLPFGILLALGRRSTMPIMRLLSTLFIELWRGVPLITVLFMSSVMLPLFLPEGVVFDKLLRALIAVSLFSSAYMAEVVRGGLQAIPQGQYEAGEALGLTYRHSMVLVILPQALKHVIPGIVNTFIGLFKDTTLVAVIGMFDLLGIIQAASTHPDWLGFALEGYVFAGIFFWVCCFAMSRFSIYLEGKLQKGQAS